MACFMVHTNSPKFNLNLLESFFGQTLTPTNRLNFMQIKSSSISRSDFVFSSLSCLTLWHMQPHLFCLFLQPLVLSSCLFLWHFADTFFSSRNMFSNIGIFLLKYFVKKLGLGGLPICQPFCL